MAEIQNSNCQLQDKFKVKVQAAEKPYQFLLTSKKRFNVLYGGAGSAKSWTLALYLILKAAQEPNSGFLVVRKTLPAVKNSCLNLIRAWLNKLQIEYDENKAENTITIVQSGSFFLFVGLDDVEKKKSIEGINYVWIEEATEITRKEFLQLNLRCRARNIFSINQLFLSFNPVDPIANKWLVDITQFPNKKIAVLHLTHLDNPFLAQEEREQIEDLADVDPEYDAIYRKGEWATPTYIIYRNWDIVESFPDNLPIIGYGLDFGFNNPTALLKIGTKDRKEYWIDELIYQTSLTNTNLIDRMKLLVDNRNDDVIADASEPDRIQEISEAEFNIYPCIKGPGSVNVGIDRCKRVKLHLTKDSTNTIEEIRGYKYKVDKDDNILDDPVKFKDHAMDAMRYYIGREIQIEADVIELGEYEL